MNRTEALEKINMGRTIQLIEQLDLTGSNNQDINDQNEMIVNIVHAIEGMRKGG